MSKEMQWKFFKILMVFCGVTLLFMKMSSNTSPGVVDCLSNTVMTDDALSLLVKDQHDAEIDVKIYQGRLYEWDTWDGTLRKTLSRQSLVEALNANERKLAQAKRQIDGLLELKMRCEQQDEARLRGWAERQSR